MTTGKSSVWTLPDCQDTVGHFSEEFSRKGPVCTFFLPVLLSLPFALSSQVVFLLGEAVRLQPTCCISLSLFVRLSLGSPTVLTTCQRPAGALAAAVPSSPELLL